MCIIRRYMATAEQRIDFLLCEKDRLDARIEVILRDIYRAATSITPPDARMVVLRTLQSECDRLGRRENDARLELKALAEQATPTGAVFTAAPVL